MRGNLDDLSNQIIANIEQYLKGDVEITELTDEKMCDSVMDGILFGRRELAEGLLKQIAKWKSEFYEDETYLEDKFLIDEDFDLTDDDLSDIRHSTVRGDI